jgi:hypothetical protein
MLDIYFPFIIPLMFSLIISEVGVIAISAARLTRYYSWNRGGYWCTEYAT